MSNVTKTIGLVSMALLIIGGINWGLVGLAGLDLVKMVFKSIPLLMKLVYVLVGAAGVWQAVLFFKKQG